MMKVKQLYSLVFFLSLVMVYSCGGSDDGPGTSPDPDPQLVLNPEQAVLVFPDNNAECTSGVEVSDTEAKVVFDWQKANNATSYKLYVKNLDSDVVTEYDASTDRYEATIERSIPYSWYVVSKSNKTTNTATSETWKFYLAGKGVENYAPFPAELTSPENDANISTTTVTLEWNGSDVDFDIKEYDVLLDLNMDPTTIVQTTSDQKLENHTVESGKTYYWKIVTRDEIGNTSTSQVYSFKVD